MVSATLFFASRAWLWLAAAFLVLAFVVITWSYRSLPAGPVRWICAGLKALGFIALLLCLLEPLSSGMRAKPGANLFAVIADNSQGLQIKDRGALRTRGDTLRELLDPDRSQWLASLADNFELRRYLFDARLQTTKDFSELDFNGRASAIGSSLRMIAERYHGRPLAGILLLTDGNATDIRTLPELTGLPPIYPVVIGSPEPVRDLAIAQAHSTQTDFEDEPVSVQADVMASGFSGQAVVGRVMDVQGRKIAEQTLTPRKDDETLAFRFQLKPEKPGVSFYQVRVRAKDELGRTAAQGSSEATLANNSTVLVVDRGHGPYRILYVAGRPNWDFKFLNRALEQDDQLQLVALMRVARREPKFNFLGRSGETSNPLFRGFGNQSAEDVERYDQPVLVRLNTRDQLELRTGFPSTPEELYAYHAVIIGDLESEFFTPDQAALVQRFVSERGGGFLMLGGMESFQQGKYEHTPIGEMLPVYLDPCDETNPPGPLRLELTREGLLQSWARLRDTEAAERQRLQNMAPFQVLNRIQEVKPGAMVISKVKDDASGKSYPALVVQRFGRGRTAALMLGDVWHWGLHDAEAHRDMDKAWRQLARWLVNDVPNRVELSAQPQPEDPNGAILLQVRVRDPRFQPLDNATVNLQIESVIGSGPETVSNSNLAATGARQATKASPTARAPGAVRIQVEPSTSEPGLYQATYVPRTTGGYQASVCVTNSEGLEVGCATAGWSTDLAAEEFRSLTPNVALLEALARKTGGEIIPAGKLGAFARNLPHRTAPIMESWTRPLWDTPLMFVFALTCFVAEWGVRRWKGLP